MARPERLGDLGDLETLATSRQFGSQDARHCVSEEGFLRRRITVDEAVNKEPQR
ncbi:MAG: hypothetical protein INR71_01680 [Terriglobus roseus]|nr:hypothetical protein [Terriglobus roseus]